MLSKGTVIGNTWRVENYLGEGACAKVYVVSPTGKPINYEVVAKVIPTGNGTKSKKDKEQDKLCNTLYYEYVLLTGLLHDFPYRAQLPLKFSGVDEEHKLRYLVMEKFEIDLKGLAKQRIPTPAKASDIGIQILNGLQWLHQKGFVFVDVKPDNFMIKGDKVFFVDFGLVERIGVTPTGAAREFVGTPTYCSLSLNRGGEPSPKDDLEALGYVLLSIFNNGELPWEHTHSDSELLALKTNTDIREFAKTLGCNEVGDFILQARSSANYEQLLGHLQALGTRVAHTTTNKVRRSSGKPTKIESVGTEEPRAKPSSTLTAKSLASKPTKRQKLENSIRNEESETVSADDTIEVTQVKKKVVPAPATAKPKLEKQHTVSLEAEPPTNVSKKIGKSLSKPEIPDSIIRKEESEAKENILNFFSSPKRKKSSKSSSYHLRVVAGPHKDAIFNIDQLYGELEEKLIHLGRDEDNNIVFSGDFTVSSKHLTLKKMEEGMFIKDNGSMNKTKVNDQPIYSRRWFQLQPNDKVSIGETEFEIIIQ